MDPAGPSAAALPAFSIGRTTSLPPAGRSSFDHDSPSYHTLSSILNNPHVGKSGVYGSDGSWAGWFAPAAVGLPDLPPPMAAAKTLFPEVSRTDFLGYLASVSEPFSRFEDIRHHELQNADLGRSSFGEVKGSDLGAPSVTAGSGPGVALVACLREVPSLYFKEDFALEEGSTFRAACPFASAVENAVLQERLSHYLDVVEMHLVREIGLRSDSFFEAQGQLQDLNGKILEACGRIRGLKETIRLLEADLVGSARQIQELNAMRTNLLALQQKLRLILYVNQALSTLKLLVAAADCAGALDVTDDLQHLLDGDELTGLHCLRHLRDQLAMSIDAINSILSAEFMRACIHDAKYVDSIILSKLKLRASNALFDKENEIKLDEEESSAVRDRLLPLIVGLLRTAKLSIVLRIYRDTLVGDMKTAIKNTVAELLPVLSSRSSDSDFSAERPAESDGGSLSLANKLRSLSSENFVQLLVAIFRVAQAHLVRASEVKKVIEWIMGNLDGCYAPGENISDSGYIEELGGQINPYLSFSFQKNVSRVTSVQGKTNEFVVSPNATKNFRADVLRENTEAVFAACDAAHGRWAKLLGVRALLHPKLRLQEFVNIYSISQDFMAATEKIGGRSCFSIRGTLQSQSKAFVECQHDTRITKIRAVLDQETWVSVEVPDEFQAIVDGLTSSGTSIDGDIMNGYVNPTASNGIETIQKSDDSIGTSTGQAKEVEGSKVSSDDTKITEHGRPASQTIVCRGIGYHMVNCGLILLKMLSEYIDFNKCLPSLSPEVVNRVIEILKLFNTRTCQLVLGAGAMQVSGLKSITSKHLALASQVVSFVYAIIPDIRRILLLQINDSRKAQLQSDIIDRVAEDYKVHKDEIHTKLVQIMRERVLVHLRGLPQLVDGWNRPEDNDPQPSQFARSLTKEVAYLHRVLSRTLLEVDVQLIFRQVVQILHSQISDAFSALEINTPQANNRFLRDIQHILSCIRTLPPGNLNETGAPNYGKLDELLAHRNGMATVDQ